MSKDAEKSGIGARHWTGARSQQQPDEKVVTLARPVTQSREYVAFELRDRAERLHIRRATQPSRHPAYHYLMDIIEDHDFGSMFTLIYSFMVVEVTGQNLGPIVHAVSFGNCERMYEFHRKLHDPPAPGEPIIEAIKITAVGEKE